MNTPYESFNWVNETLNYPLIPFIHEYLFKEKRDIKILEVGIGNGALLRSLQNAEYDSEGFDISQVAIDLAIKNGCKNVSVSSIEDFKTDKKYDYIICFSTLYYLRSFWYDFMKLIDLLKPNGKIICNFINPIRSKDKWTSVSFREFKQAIKYNNLTIDRVIPQSIFTGGIPFKCLTKLNIYILRK
jgi:2-polyprenyl-3-methyl-5-hydroxy-6-metoxy-1,4-benzoquinol methylase